MKHINESIIGRRGTVPQVNVPKKAEDLEHVKSWKTLHGYAAEFNIEIPRIRQKGLGEVTDFIYSMIFENRKNVANTTQWIMKDLGLSNYVHNLSCDTRFLYKDPDSGTYTVNLLYAIQNRSPLFDEKDNDIWYNIYKIVCKFDNNIGLDDIKLRIMYVWNAHNELDQITVFLN